MQLEPGRELIRFAAACAAALVLTAASAADPAAMSAPLTYPTSSESAAQSPGAADDAVASLFALAGWIAGACLFALSSVSAEPSRLAAVRKKL